MVKAASAFAPAYVEDKEGFVSKAYRDSGGVITIGIGFTMLSTVFSAYWVAKKGHSLKMGDTMTRAEATEVLIRLFVFEYAPPVDARFPDIILQNQFDGALDTTFNCGAGTLKDRWAVALAKGNVAGAAELLKTTRVTAKGKRLSGLVRRRASAAKLILTGDYGKIDVDLPASVSQGPDEVAWYQTQLSILSFYPETAIDGLEPSSHSAVVNYQMSKPSDGLKADGIVGPATRASLIRDVEAKALVKSGSVVTAGSGAVGGGSEAMNTPDVSTIDWHTLLTIGKWALIAGIAILVISFIWRRRGTILRQRTPT